MNLRAGLTWRGDGPLLVLGNPPWITASALGRLESGNHPQKRNLNQLPGLAARTGSANFDIAEAVWIKLIEELAPERPTIALLCKTAVARKVLEFVLRRDISVVDTAVHRIDAGRWFGAAVSACLLRFTIGAGRSDHGIRIPVFATLAANEPSEFMSFQQGRLTGDADAVQQHAFALGACPLTWRQGIKHDAAAILELVHDTATNSYRNGLGKTVSVEPEFLYPLRKGTDLRKAPADRPRRALILTQNGIGQPTSPLEQRAPRLWDYLQRHKSAFAGRKSSIYRGQPAFAIFGVGPYSFAPYKVAVCGLYRTPSFQLDGPIAGRPVMVDDTCYLLPCTSAAEAAGLCALYQDPAALALIRALSFADAKRPVTKGLLQRIDVSAILMRADRAALLRRAADALAEQDEPCQEAEQGLPAAIDRLSLRFQTERDPT